MVLPLACFVLGWLHTINDEKISSIGRYIRTTFRDRIRELTGDDYLNILGWEGAVHASAHRRWRKLVQLISNLVTFVAPGALALPAYWYLGGAISRAVIVAAVIEGILLLVLAYEIVREADIDFGAPLLRRLKTSGERSHARAKTPNTAGRADG